MFVKLSMASSPLVIIDMPDTVRRYETGC